MTTTHFFAETLEQGAVIGSDGLTIGNVGQVYLDNQTGQPSWVTVKTDGSVPANPSSP
jgi:sporulation protein YlmC with PRC-barrel domain